MISLPLRAIYAFVFSLIYLLLYLRFVMVKLNIRSHLHVIVVGGSELI